MSALIKREIIYMTKNNLEVTKLLPGEERPYELLSVWSIFTVSSLLCCFERAREWKKKYGRFNGILYPLDWPMKFSEISFPGFWS